jgi:hypothetical protein
MLEENGVAGQQIGDAHAAGFLWLQVALRNIASAIMRHLIQKPSAVGRSDRADYGTGKVGGRGRGVNSTWSALQVRLLLSFAAHCLPR